MHIAYLHNQSQSVAVNGQAISPIAIVTALVDRIEVANRHIFVDKDIKLSGFTSWVGKTSCEVSMKMEQESVSGVWEPLVDAKFLMCARDTENKGPAVMNPLEIINDQERTIFQLGERRLFCATFNSLDHLLFCMHRYRFQERAPKGRASVAVQGSAEQCRESTHSRHVPKNSRFQVHIGCRSLPL